MMAQESMISSPSSQVLPKAREGEGLAVLETDVVGLLAAIHQLRSHAGQAYLGRKTSRSEQNSYVFTLATNFHTPKLATPNLRGLFAVVSSDVLSSRRG